MPTDTRAQTMDPQDIAAVETGRDTEMVNKYLRCGWVITAIARSQSGPDSVSVVYHLGWPRQLGEVVEPEEVVADRKRWDELLKKQAASLPADLTGDIPF